MMDESKGSAEETCHLLQGVLVLLMLVSSDIIFLINYSTYAMTLSYLGCMAALFWFRYKEPELARPFKVSQ